MPKIIERTIIKMPKNQPGSSMMMHPTLKVVNNKDTKYPSIKVTDGTKMVEKMKPMMKKKMMETMEKKPLKKIEKAKLPKGFDSTKWGY